MNAPLEQTQLPEWLISNQPEPGLPTVLRKSHQLSSEQRQLEKQTFAIAFESALEYMADGGLFEQFCRNYHTPLSKARFITWICKDERRKAAYYNAKEILAETMEEELLRIADGLNHEGLPSPEEVQRSIVRINTRKWLMEKFNRRRYGDVKHIEQNTTSTSTIDVRTMTTDDLKRYVLRQAGVDADTAYPEQEVENDLS